MSTPYDGLYCPLRPFHKDGTPRRCQDLCAFRVGDECAVAVAAKALRGLSAVANNNHYGGFLAKLFTVRLSDSVAEAARKELLGRLRELEADRP